MIRNFLWEGFEKRKGDHLVGWEKVCKSKRRGGLGIGNIVSRNHALLGKWIWRFPREPNAFWHLIIRSKYGIQDNGWDTNVVDRGTHRSPWKAISQGIEGFVRNTKYRVGDGARTRFWVDRWASNTSLAALFPRLYRIASSPNATVRANVLWGDDSSYTWDITFRRNFNEIEMNEFMDLMGLLNNWRLDRFESDSRLWVGEKNGAFSTKSYFDIISDSQEVDFRPYSMVWKGCIPQKVKVLAWLTVWKRINTADVLQQRKPFLQISPAWCAMCKRGGETVDHLLLHCPIAQYIWANVRRELGLVTAFPETWHSVLSISWYIKGSRKKAKILWRCCLAVMWCIWKERNSRIFEDKEATEDELWSRVKALASLWAYSSNAFGVYSITDISRDWAAVLG